jgi:hypothetical protein
MQLSVVRVQKGYASSFCGVMSGSNNKFYSHIVNGVCFPTCIKEELWENVEELEDGIYAVRHSQKRIIDISLICNLEDSKL